MSPGGKLPPRLAAVVVPVGLLGFGVAVAAAVSFAVSPRDLATLAGIAGLLAASTLAERYPVPLDGIDTGGVSLGFRLLHRVDRALRLAGRRRRRHGRADHAPARASPADPGDLQRGRDVDRRRRLRRCDRAVAGRRGRARLRPGHRGRLRLLQRQPDPDQPRGRRQRAQAVQDRRAHERRCHGHAVCADGVGGPDARHPLAALAVPLGGARRAAARNRALPALDLPRAARNAAGADGPAHRARQPPPLPRPARARARRLAGAGLPAQPLPRGHRRFQEDQRPLRPSRRRQGACPAGDEPAPGRRGLPARRRRVRDPPPRPRRGGRAHRCRVDHRADLRRGPADRRDPSPSAPGSRRRRSTMSAATSSSGAPTAPSTGRRNTARTRRACTGRTWSRSRS